MCGIVGIISKENGVAFEIYPSLSKLQHRGQDATGICTYSLKRNNAVAIKKSKGLVSEVFKKEDLEELVGNVGIGHVRYPTTKGKNDAQPFYEDFGGIVLAHNGHLLNDDVLRNKMKEKNIYCNSDCDAETILKLLSYYFIKKEGSVKEKCFGSVQKIMNLILGSYSVVAVVRNGGLLVFRDPYAIRPLVYGKNKNIFAFASETSALRRFSDIKDVQPGEAIFIDKNLNLESRIINQKGRAHCMFEWVYFSSALSAIEGIKVNSVRGNLGKELANIYKKNLMPQLVGRENEIIVTAVPETARPAAVVFSEETGYRRKDALVKDRYAGRTFIKPSQKERNKAVHESIIPVEEVVKDKIVFIVDDSVVRGTTSQHIVKSIRDCGAKEVHLFSTCPPLKHPCKYGIDFPTHTELIAYNRDTEEIRKFIGADSLTYMTIDGLVRAIGMPKENVCMACLNGCYPTELKKSIKL